MSGTKAICAATNHAVLDIGVAAGVFASESTVPYYVFLDAGMQVDVASPLGGIIPVDPLSMKAAIRTAIDDRLLGDAAFRDKLTNSLPLADLDFTAYDIVYFAGGRGAAFDRGQSEVLGRRVSDAYAAGRVTGGICHGPLGLLRGRTPSGESIVKGRDHRGHGPAGPAARNRDHAAPSGNGAQGGRRAVFESKSHPAADFFANHFVADGDLITGQNQNAGAMVARLMMQRVRSKKAAAAA